EAVFLRGEVVVKRVAGDAGPPDDVGDGHGAIAARHRLLGEGGDDPGALVTRDELARKTLPAGGRSHRRTVSHERHGTGTAVGSTWGMLSAGNRYSSGIQPRFSAPVAESGPGGAGAPWRPSPAANRAAPRAATASVWRPSRCSSARPCSNGRPIPSIAARRSA